MRYKFWEDSTPKRAKRFFYGVIVALAVLTGGILMPASAAAAPSNIELRPISQLAQCNKGSFIGLPTWYKYLDTAIVKGKPICNPVISELKDLWLIGLAILEILLRLSVLIAIGYVMHGGFRFITARGDPEKIGKARTMTVDALIGLVIAMIAIASVSFIGGRFTQ